MFTLIASQGIYGRPEFAAPEMLAGGRYNHKVDIWSAGVMLYYM